MRTSRPVAAIAVVLLLGAGALPGRAVAPGPFTRAVRLDPPPRTLTVAAVGDWLAEEVVNEAAAAAAPPGVRFDHEPLLRPIAPVVGAVDLAICHMETPIGPPGAPAGFLGRSANGTSLIAAPFEVAGDLRRVGFDRCSTASNHAYDLGTEGIRTTLEALDAAGISHSGTARSPEEAAVDVFPVNGVRVAHVSYARNSNTGWPRDEWRLDRAVTAAPVIDDARAARAAGAELVVVSLHVYVELQYGPSAEDRALVAAITAQSDVDLVIVHGPHVVQPVERVNGTWVYWSVGNFISGMGTPSRPRYSDPRTLDGLMATVRFTERPDGGWSAEPWTVLSCTLPGSRTVHPALTSLAGSGLSATERAQLAACLTRSATVVADLH